MFVSHLVSRVLLQTFEWNVINGFYDFFSVQLGFKVCRTGWLVVSSSMVDTVNNSGVRSDDKSRLDSIFRRLISTPWCTKV